jgi:hypothetical protein
MTGDTMTELDTGILGATYSTTGREITTKTVIVNGYEPGCNNRMYLVVVSDRVY